MTRDDLYTDTFEQMLADIEKDTPPSPARRFLNDIADARPAEDNTDAPLDIPDEVQVTYTPELAQPLWTLAKWLGIGAAILVLCGLAVLLAMASDGGWRR